MGREKGDQTGSNVVYGTLAKQTRFTHGVYTLADLT